MMKIFALIYVIYSIPLCLGMDYDEEFTTGQKQLSRQVQSKVFKLVKQDKDYYEIHNANCILTIYKEDTQVAKLGEDKEYGYYFKYDSNYVYYIKFDIPSYSSEFYAFYVSTGDEELNILSSSLTLRFAKEREFSISVANQETTPQIIAFEIYFDSQYGIVNSISIEENSENFVPCSSKYDTYSYKRSYYYYAIITNELIFKPIMQYQYSSIWEFKKATLRFQYETYLISENTTKCVSKDSTYNYRFYKINPPSNKPYYEISFKQNSLLYALKDNFNKEEITSITKYSVDSYGYLMTNSLSNEACFSVIFSDEKNTISEDTAFSLPLFDSRNYDILFKGTKKYIQIKYPKNDYFNLTIYSKNEGKEINYKFYNTVLKEYVYIFSKDSNELPIQFRFTKIRTISNYYTIQIIYNGLDDDIQEEIVENDNFKCVEKTTFFTIKHYPEKEYIYLLISDMYNSYLNFEKIYDIHSSYNFYELKENKILQIYPSEKNICFELIYGNNKDEFKINRIKKRNFNIVNENIFKIEFYDLKINKEYFIHITTKNDNIEFTNYILDKQYNFKELIDFKAKSGTQKFELPVKLKNINNIDILHIHFYYNETIEADRFECFDTTVYYNLSKNSEKPYIYLIANDTENILLNNIKLSDMEGVNNFYDLNENKVMIINAQENNIICFNLIYEKKKGFFELNGMTQKNFPIFLDNNNLQFDISNLIKDTKYNIEIVNEDNNLQFDYYKIGDKKYEFNYNISFIADTEKVIFELPVKSKTKNTISNFSIWLVFVETINKDIFACLNTLKYYKINYIQGKDFIYLVSNDSSKTYLNNKTLMEYYYFYEYNNTSTLDIYADQTYIICFELKYVNNEDYFVIDSEQDINFNIFSYHFLKFNFTNLISDIYYYIEITSKNSNIFIDDYKLDGKSYSFSGNLIDFKTTKSSITFGLPVTLENKNGPDKLNIKFYHEKIEETAVKVASIITYCFFGVFGLIISIRIGKLWWGKDEKNKTCNLLLYNEKFMAVYLFKRD